MNQYFKKGAYILIALSLLVSCMQGVLRIKAEQQYKDLQVAVRYTDIIDVAQQMDRPIQEVLQDLKDKGATTILVRENTLLPNLSGDLANWKAQGELTSYEGYELIRMHSEAQDIRQVIQAELNYISVKDEDLYTDILTEITVKRLGGKEIVLDEERYIEYRGSTNTMSTTGMGFPLKDLEIAANMGYVISPQAKAWPGATDESVKNFVDTIDRIPNLSVIYFADGEVTGATEPEMIELAKRNQIGFIEFFSSKQKGLFSLVKKASEEGTNYKVVRLHTATDGEANKLTSPEIISRYWLAATERNQQVLLFKMPNTQDIYEDFITLETEIEGFVQKAEANGFKISHEIGNYNLPRGNFIFAFLSGLAPIVLFVLFLDLIGQRKAGVLLGIIGAIGYAGILKIRPTLGLQLMALFGASIFPAYAVLYSLQKQAKNIRGTIWLFLQTCVISFGGAITIVGLLSRTNFGLTIDLFVGVKLAHLIPILLIVVGYIYKRYGISVDFIKDIITNKVTYLALIIMGLIGAVLIIYTTRTGNVGSISNIELAFRSGLDRILGVRPRTKEFMIGYPIMITLFYYGYKEGYLPLLAISTIGQISLVNTYAHVHTPVLISLIRSGYGLVFGLINGLILIYVINKVIKVANQWNLKRE